MTEAMITMSTKELTRLEVVNRVRNKELKRKAGAELLGITPRHMGRLVAGYIRSGPRFLVSQRRGRPSNRAYNESFKRQVLQIVEQEYADFSPTLASEKLLERQNLTINRETLRQWMMEAGMYRGKKRRACTVHQQRCRRSQLGELVQIDGSPHAWFEDRGENCCLLVFIDDATSRLMALHFEPTETTLGYFTALRGYIKQHGLPAALYSDKNSIFRIPQREAVSGDGQSQFGRAMHELGITLICANTPQAKGRVEKANNTLQDRLVKELRLRNISDIETANAYLPEFMESYNKKFAVSPASDVNAHRDTKPDEDILTLIFSAQETRKLSKNLELSYKNKIYQIDMKQPGYGLRKAQVTVCDDLKGSIRLRYKDRILPYKIFDKKNQPQSIVPPKQISEHINKGHKPATDHPWRDYEKIKQKKAAQAAKVSACG